jgi:hypothetical protein
MEFFGYPISSSRLFMFSTPPASLRASHSVLELWITFLLRTVSGLTEREAVLEMDGREEKEIPVKVRVIFEIPAEDGDMLEMETSMQIELSEDSVEQIKTLFFETKAMSVTVMKREKPTIVIALDP